MINQLREAIKLKKQTLIQMLIEGRIIEPEDPSIHKLTLSELEWMARHLPEPDKSS